MKVDMSPKAIDGRLRRVSELRRLCLELGKSRPAGAENSGKITEPPREYKAQKQSKVKP